MSDRDELGALVRQFRTHLQHLEAKGGLGVRAGRSPRPPVETAEIDAHADTIDASEDPVRKRLSLTSVRAELGDCQRCKLAPLRTNLVFGVGRNDADLMFVGEAPGADEDRLGEPFVGRAGELLTKMIGAMGFRREDVYIANILKCLRYKTPVLLENGSWERVGRLVNQRFGGRVMSVDPEGYLVPRRVTGWHASPLAGRRLFRLSYVSSARAERNRPATYLTHDHEVMTRRGWVAAEDLRADDEIAIGQGLSDAAREVAIGSLLGDASINKLSAYLQMAHSRDQEAWVALKARSWTELRPLVYPMTATVRGRTHLTTHCRTRAHRALRVLRREFYPEGKKRLPSWLRLTPRVAAVWFLDDGYTRRRSDRSALSELAAHSFDDVEIQRLIVLLREDLGIEAYTRDSSRGRIHFGAEASKRLSELVAPFCPPSLRYKLHPSAGLPFDASLYQPGGPRTLFDRAMIEPAAADERDETVYCIDVEDTHNFVTAGGVVHNCRPPGNRNPEPDEIEQCEPFLRAQIDAIRPRVLVALGKFSAQCLLRSDAPIGALRGRWHEYQGVRLMPTFHPAYLLRDPRQKKVVWDDLQMVMKELDRLGIEPTIPRATTKENP